MRIYLLFEVQTARTKRGNAESRYIPREFDARNAGEKV